MQKEQCKKDKTIDTIVRMAEEVAEIFVDGMQRCANYMAMTVATVRPFEDDPEGVKLKHSVDLLVNAIYSALVYNSSQSEVEDFDVDHTIDVNEDGETEIVFHAKRLRHSDREEEDC